MARIRSIKPEFFESEDVSALPFRARLTWIGLWVHCDNYGRHKDNVKLVKKNVWPLDQVSLADVEEDLAILADHGRIVRYEVDGRGYLAVVNWDRHQSIARPGAPKYPAPPVDNAVDNIPASTPETDQGHDSDAALRRTDTSLGNREQGTGKGRDARERASPCPRHPNGTTEPCGTCKDARLAADALEVEKRQRERDSPKCRTHRGQPADNCAGCLSEKKGAA